MYTLDGLGNPTTTTVNAEFNPTFDTLTYQYDGLNRLQHFNAAYGPTGTLDYTYDTGNNRQTLNQNGVVTVYSYDGADRLLTINDQATGADNDGNVLSRPGFSYQYDQADRLTQVTVGSGSNTCTGHSIYDGDGRRISHTNTGSCLANGHTYVDDVSGSLPQLIEDGSLYYIRGMGLAYTVDLTNGVASVFHTDGRGSVRAITDQNGVLAQSYQYDPSGIQTASGTSQQVLGYTGEPQDPDNGLVYLRARSYDPAIGRFLERDSALPSAGNPDSLNRYTYAGNNPTSNSDPSGHWFFPFFGFLPQVVNPWNQLAAQGWAANQMAANPNAIINYFGNGDYLFRTWQQHSVMFHGRTQSYFTGTPAEFIQLMDYAGGFVPYDWGGGFYRRIVPFPSAPNAVGPMGMTWDPDQQQFVAASYFTVITQPMGPPGTPELFRSAYPGYPAMWPGLVSPPVDVDPSSGLPEPWTPLPLPMSP